MSGRESVWGRLTRRVKAAVGRLRRRIAGESNGDDWGSWVHPLDLYDGMKGYEWMGQLWQALRRRPPAKAQPAPTSLSDARAREMARVLERHNPTAQAILSALRSYVLGDQGLHLEVLGKPDGDTALVAQAQEYLDHFRDVEDWWSRERELYNRCHRDGEGNLRFFADQDCVRVRPIEPEHIVAPDASPEWTEGIRTAPDDAETVEAIWVQTGATPQDGEEVPAEQCYLIRANVDRCIRRGVSDFAAIAPLVEGALDCLKDMLGAETVRQGIVLITQYPDSAPADLEQAMMQQSDISYLDRSGVALGQGEQRTPYHVQVPRGIREIHLTGNHKFAALPEAASVQSAISAINTACLVAASRYHMPQWLVTGDASRNNAIDLAAESPFGRFIADEQAWFGKHVRNVMWRVLQIAVDRGDLPEALLDAVDLSVTPQTPAEQRDAKKETERNQILFQSGLMGRPTWAAREGLDFESEQDDIRRYGGPPDTIPGGQPATAPAPAPPSAPANPGPAKPHAPAYTNGRGAFHDR